MKISLKWLNEYVDVGEYLNNPRALADLLTQAGLEVEAIEDRKAQCRHIVVGQIIEKGAHPQADRLTVCRVTTGEGQEYQIVCGAKNHQAGNKVVLALPGAVLPGGLVIQKSKLRGVESGGMLCSEKELGLTDESSGIMLLPDEAPLGINFADYQGADDVVFELKVTPNRADCLSHFGLAREIAALLARKFSAPQVHLQEAAHSTREMITLKMSSPDLCPRYCGRALRGVKVGESPAWLKKRLESVGLNSINNVVDVTNFVMLELGQPLHAFDMAQIRGSQIIIERAVQGETFATLDGTQLHLTGDELMIRDAERPVALAGVVGGKNSGVSSTTTDLFIESAYFLPQTVRRSSRKFGIETDSSYRFSRGVDPEITIVALNRACVLIQELAGGEIAGQPYDEYPSPVKIPSIMISLSEVEESLGYRVTDEKFVSWMKRLGCEVHKRTTKTAGRDQAQEGESTADEASYEVLPPAYRVDLTMSVDLVEEYARLEGYEHIPEQLPPMTLAPTAHQRDFVLGQTVHRLLQAQGYQQAVNYAFVGEKWQAECFGDPAAWRNLGLVAEGQVIPILNPLNEELNVMRVSLLPGLIKNGLQSYRYGSTCGRVYEQGLVFSQVGQEYVEHARLSLIGWGYMVSPWYAAEKVPIIYDLKQAIEGFLKSLNIKSWRWQMVAVDLVPGLLHPGQTALLSVEGTPVGFVGTLHPELREKFKFRQDCALAELDLDRLLRNQPRLANAENIGKFPAVERDLAFILPEGLTAGAIAEEIRKVAGHLLRELTIFDVFKGAPLDPTSRSVGFRMKYQDNEATLDENRLQEMQNQIIDSISQKFSVSIR